MLFEELVQQHCVHRFVANRVSLALIVASYEVRIYLFHFLGYEAELRDARRIKLVLVTKSHWFKRENRFARLVHRLDRVLETLRGDDGAEVTVSIDNYPDTSSHRH